MSDFDQPFDFIVSDVSFISLRLVLPSILPLARADGDLVVLIKPQFEAGRQEASRGRGVITDPTIWRRVLHEVIGQAESDGATLRGILPSSTKGMSGNVEFVTWLRCGRSSILSNEGVIDSAINQVSPAND